MIHRVSNKIAIVVVCVIAAGGMSADAQLHSTREYQIKAAFLYNFAKFIEWPAEAFTDGDAPITICILGEDPFGAVLESVEGKTVRSRKVAIKRFENPEDLRFCHILFISSSEKESLSQILESVKDSSVVTVGEARGFTYLGGIIGFTITKNRLRFAINVDAAERAGLEISSRLLKLATVVKQGRQRQKN